VDFNVSFIKGLSEIIVDRYLNLIKMKCMKTAILVIGRHEEIMETLLRIIHKNEQWSAQAALTDEEAVELFDKFLFDIVLLSSGIEEDSEQKLRAHLKEKKPSIIIIQHYGGGSGLLSNEILQALENMKM
jgi:DNA-binding NtrC family response regulator